VLVVEDESALRGLAMVMIERLGYRVAGAANGAAALALVVDEGLRPDLILTDVVMPGMSGHALAERLSSTLPDAKVVYMSGYTDDAIAHHGVLDPGIDFLQKPFAMADLAAMIRSVLARE
jgi:two-component system cell cycle sensor histidine kinase/response regulator CckA